MSGTRINSLPLKDYQQSVLETLDIYLETLATSFKREKRNYELDVADGEKDPIPPEKSFYCANAWERVKGKTHIPIYRNEPERRWQPRTDGTGRQIPNICMKVPTGGGKTLIAACALGRISRDYFKSSRGLVLWVVPSATIYRQTLNALRDKDHPYRKQLDLETGGRTKVLERGDELNVLDTQNNLCVMVLMLQSFNVSKKSKDARKIYSNTGRYKSFFPEDDDYMGNNNLLNQVPNLEEDDMLERDVIKGVTVKQSLGNVFRICRPIVIIDEEHRAKSVKAIDNINEFNPRFILEFSATPREGSNKLVDVGGQSLKQEEMIRLPINVHASDKEDWKTTLDAAHAKLDTLTKDAGRLQSDEGTYIRPIMVIIAEPKKKEQDYNQVDEIKRYLIDKCQAQENQIRVKLSENDEIKEEDLLDKLCPVRYIITKDALREGWDCPFAYVLAILTQKNSATALTQYVGRVLRQPYATLTPVPPLNESYVYCTKANVEDAVTKIKEGLEREGMGDIGSDIRGMDNSNLATEREKVTIKRHKDFQKQIFLPSLTVRFPDGTFEKFDYYRDILGHIDWSEYDCENLPIMDSSAEIKIREATVDYKADLYGQYAFDHKLGKQVKVSQNSEIDIPLLTAQLTDKIPNPFEARRIIGDVIQRLRDNGLEDAAIAIAGHMIVKQVKDDAFKWLLEKSEEIFVQKLERNEIILKLLATPYLDLNWDMRDTRDVYKNIDEAPASGMNKNIFQPQYNSNYNGLELKVASYINGSEATKWWHRLGVRGTEYHVQGWKKDKIYPDFLITLQDDRFLFLETKGNHLENPDSEYKAKVFDHLTKHANKSIGEFKLISGEKEIEFDLVYESEWEEELTEKGIY